ncbi:potassium channel family protein [Bacillus tuaregi]|uniref:potassium channel family protein n=1 Tax=Bacillus tuaregi TaxID=1816695 RepID=UPI0008F8A34B|nr:TrkA family potassium uptake protein [Bacillus tuaregi]
MKQYLVIGAGRFGSGIIKELHNKKQDVVVCDVNRKKLDAIDHLTTYCIIGDFRDNDVLDQIRIDEFDAVFIAIGTDAYSAILITKKMKDRNAKKIIAKANNQEVGEILYSLGANQVVFPEEEAGKKIARQEMMTGVIEYLAITENVSVIETEVPEQLCGKTLMELDFSRKFGLMVSLILRNGEPLKTHLAETPFQKGDYMLIVGDNKKIDRFKRRFS